MNKTDEILRQQKERESKKAEEFLQKSPEDLLKEIFSCSTDHLSQSSEGSISRTIAYFSALLVILSRQAEESTKKIVKLTKTLTYLTWVIAIFTAVLLILGSLQLRQQSIIPNLNLNNKTEQTQQNNLNTQPKPKNEVYK